ncbi:hydroxyacid dehydrogenase [Marinobacter sp.]|uniref:hydroxyacid dehydrogenase n=1 Tax=Marinobacter sp. TaxID=50741 RepID=UPI00384F92D0
MIHPNTGARPTVCVVEPIHEDALSALRACVRLITPEENAMNRWVEEADAIIVRNNQISGTDIAAARKLKVIGKHGAGTDTIDIEEAARRGIPVLSTPGVNAASVADLAVAMAMSLARNLSGHTEALRAGTPLAGQKRIGFEMAELPPGIIGFGAIGRAVAQRLQTGFGAPVMAYDPFVPETAWPPEIARAQTVDALVRNSRLLFLHVGLSDETRGMIGADQLSAMPANSFLINCARGGVVDETALVNALTSGQLAGAASDVFEQEPPSPDHPLLQHPGFIATPHIGASTEAGLRRTGLEVVNKVLAALNGQ